MAEHKKLRLVQGRPDKEPEERDPTAAMPSSDLAPPECTDAPAPPDAGGDASTERSPETKEPSETVVLVADDDPMIRMLARQSLTRSGLDVIEAENGFDAIERFRDRRPDLVLCDVLMPGMDGFEVCRALREEPETDHVPILMLTGLEDVQSIDRAFSAGATDFATKPINWGLLPHRVRYALRASRAIRELKVSEERYALAAEGANDGLWDWDLTNNRIFFAPRWKRMLGFADEDVGTNPSEWFDRLHPEDRAGVMAAIAAHTEGEHQTFEAEYRIETAEGEYEWMLSRGLAVCDSTGQSYRMVGSQTNINTRKKAEQQLLFDAFHDALTRLPNRALFLDRLDHCIQLAERREGYQFAVVFIDLDRFKVINDSLGHLMGDHLLLEVAKRISSTLRVGDTLARLGGDEFIILCEDIADVPAVTRVVERIMQVLAEPIDLQGKQVVTTASMGISFSTTGYSKPEDMLRDADAAMYRAKAAGRGQYKVFDAEMHRHAVNILTLESELRTALEEQQFRVHYQPILDLASNDICGFEALVRWEHPERGLLLPDQFIGVAEETRVIVPLGRWVLREACRQLNAWRESWPETTDWFVAVNVSGVELSTGDLVAETTDALHEIGLPPQCLKLEITESSLIANGQRALDAMHALKSHGIQLSIDDFGTGYSSFSYLHRFPFDVLKIDASFISNFDADPERVAIVQTIISLAHNLGLTVVAEGSETERDLASLRDSPCEYAQGFSISRPGDAKSMTDLLESRLEQGKSRRKKAAKQTPASKGSS